MTSVHQTGVKLISGDEHDAFSRWRRILSSFTKAGKAKAIKRAYNRRVRRTSSPERYLAENPDVAAWVRKQIPTKPD